jgi:hypothetical protein
MDRILILLALMASCKNTRPKDSPREILPFEQSSAFFNGTYKNSSQSAYIFKDKTYTHLASDAHGTMEFQGTFDTNDADKSLHLKPQYVVCDSRDHLIPIAEFEALLETKKNHLIAAYNKKNKDPEGLESLLQKYKEAKEDNERDLAKDLISQDIAKKNEDIIGGFLIFMKNMEDEILSMKKKIESIQELIGKKQKEIDEIFQMKVEDHSQIEALNKQELEKVKERNDLSAQIIGLTDTIDRYGVKIAFLKTQYPYTDGDLKKAVQKREATQASQKYRQDRGEYVKSGEAILLKEIEKNNQLIEKLKAYKPNLHTGETLQYKITEIQLWLDYGAIQSSSPLFERTGGFSGSYLADCDDAALRILSLYLGKSP